MATMLATQGTDQIDVLLDELCLNLQITDSQFIDAESKYKAVGEWLSAKESLLTGLGVEVYPQGSMLLRTTVKPRSQDEYDLDIVCLLPTCHKYNPLEVYEVVAQRLKSHGTYKNILERKKRCVRLNYAGSFHLDILPACTNPVEGGTFILVPDRELMDWTPSNPKGFGMWFESRARTMMSVHLAEKALEPLPVQGPTTSTLPLQRVTQLLKRRRDVVFNGSKNAPRSVVLTTLAAQHYAGEDSLAAALTQILNSICQEIANSPGIMEVRNPTNPAEVFSEAWTWQSYSEFREFIFNFREELRKLRAQIGLDKIAQQMGAAFGEDIARKALLSYADGVSSLRQKSLLGFGPVSVALTAASGSGRTIPRTTFFGN
jgi:hypothetical protein